jgi:hypothetical protein
MLQVGQFWMPIGAKGGSLLHAVLHKACEVVYDLANEPIEIEEF